MKAPHPIKLKINGKSREYDPPLNLRQVIFQLCKKPEHVIAELNGTIKKKDAWENTPLAEGDTLELISFVGGG